MSWSDFWHYMTGPRLYRIFKFRDQPGRPYVANSVEVYSDRVIKMVSTASSVALYASPIILTYFYRRGLITSANNYMLFNYGFIRIITTITFVYMGALLARAIGRSTNSDYKSFTEVLKSAKQKDDMSRLTLSKFDFDFAQWPIDFRWYESQTIDNKKPPQLLSSGRHSRRTVFISIPCDILNYLVVTTIGRRMLYPGSVSLLQMAISPALQEGRTKLVEQDSGERYKLLARDGNEIDCMFVDRRIRGTNRSKTLVICSEGNAGFYEIGVMVTPLNAGYSVLGWNHPGFGGSTGLPYPQNDINAMDVVIQFAVERLGFSLDQILLFGWSIGGFPSSWAAMQYPDIKGIVLDASFDDVLPLAEAKMPPSINPIVRNVIRGYFNLNVSENLNHYDGPVLFIRRLRDEIINTNDMDPFRTNRCNDLLLKLLNNRFPKLMADQKAREALMEWLHSEPVARNHVKRKYNVSDEKCAEELRWFVTGRKLSDDGDGNKSYPSMIGDDNQMTTENRIQLILYLAEKPIDQIIESVVICLQFVTTKYYNSSQTTL